LTEHHKKYELRFPFSLEGGGGEWKDRMNKNGLYFPPSSRSLMAINIKGYTHQGIFIFFFFRQGRK